MKYSHKEFPSELEVEPSVLAIFGDKIKQLVLMKKLNPIFLFLCIILGQAMAFADSKVNIKNLRLESYNILSHSHGNSLSSMLSLRPTLFEFKNVLFGVSLGYAYAHTNNNDAVNVFESTFNFEYLASSHLSIVLDVGGQYWSF